MSSLVWWEHEGRKQIVVGFKWLDNINVSGYGQGSRAFLAQRARSQHIVHVRDTRKMIADFKIFHPSIMRLTARLGAKM